MTVYILGDSNSATRNGWSDRLAERVGRKVPVRSLSLAAASSLTMWMRYLDEVELQKDDVVIWACATSEVMCLQFGFYELGDLLRFQEELIIATRKAGARFVPVVVDTIRQDIAKMEEGYQDQLDDLYAYYGLEQVNVLREYIRDTGQEFIPLRFFRDQVHFPPDGPVNNFITDLTEELIRRGGNYPLEREPLLADPTRRYLLINDFGEAVSQPLDNSLIAGTLWAPPFAVRPELPDGARAEIEGVLIYSDYVDGARFAMTAGGETVEFSATNIFERRQRLSVLSARVKNLNLRGLFIEAGDEISLDWGMTPGKVRGDFWFKESEVAAPELSRSRVMSLLLSYREDASAG